MSDKKKIVLCVGRNMGKTHAMKMMMDYQNGQAVPWLDWHDALTYSLMHMKVAREGLAMKMVSQLTGKVFVMNVQPQVIPTVVKVRMWQGPNDSATNPQRKKYRELSNGKFQFSVWKEDIDNGGMEWSPWRGAWASDWPGCEARCVGWREVNSFQANASPTPKATEVKLRSYAYPSGKNCKRYREMSDGRFEYSRWAVMSGGPGWSHWSRTQRKSWLDIEKHVASLGLVESTGARVTSYSPGNIMGMGMDDEAPKKDCGELKLDERHNCNCDMLTIMRTGCRCGGK